MTEDADFLDEPAEEKSDPEGFKGGRALVQQRCETAGIKAEETEGVEEGSTWLAVEMPAGPSTTQLLLKHASDTDALLSIEFEKYRMLGDYWGICSYSDGTIEASVRTVSSPGPSAFLRRRLFVSLGGTNTDVEPIVLKQSDEEGALTISLGTPSPELQVFDTVCFGPRSRLSVRIENSKARTHDKALRSLERLANALFFQLDLQIGVALTLQRERPRRIVRSGRSTGRRDDLKFPSREYDPQPMSLYWYAKSARGMPLLQFLAYYQILEFYMPTYSNHEAIGRVRNLLKDPRFTPDKDPQIARILAALRPSSRGFGDERSQLEAVLRRCVSAQELREFYTSHESRVEFYNDGFKSIASQKIPLRNEASDLLTETALRLYEIRCRIVHTKDQADRELRPLLPYSKEANALHEDIALIEFAATAVLIASSVAIPEP